MEWTFSLYVICNVGISTGFVLIISIGIFALFYSSKEGKKIVYERLISVDPPELEEDSYSHSDMIFGKDTCSRNDGVGILFCLLVIMTFSTTAILAFQECILVNTTLTPDDSCPEYPVDCFIFNGTAASSPINERVSFKCVPTNKTTFSNNIQDPIAWCYGWVIHFQSTRKILNELGVCSVLVGIFTKFLAIIVYRGRCIKTLVLCILVILCCIATCILSSIFKWSFAPLTRAVLSLGVAFGISGLLLYWISPKPKQTVPSNQNQSNTVV